MMADEVAGRLAAVAMGAIYASPLERTAETAAAVAWRQRRPSARKVTAHNGLLEVDYGEWSGRTLRSLSSLRAWRTLMASPSRFEFPGGETLVEAQSRAVRTCEEIARLHRGKAIGLVTHADIVKAVVCHYLGQSLDQINRMHVAPASVSVIDLPQQGPARLVSLNSNGDPTTWQ